MALEFPANPTVGQTYVSDNYTYSFDGIKWTSVKRQVTNVFDTEGQMAAHTTLAIGDWCKVLNPIREYKIGAEGDVLLDNGLYAKGIGGYAGLGLMGFTHTKDAVFTGADNKIVMQGLVSALGLEIGDVITFNNADPANNKPHTVEMIEDDNTIVVNYEHSGDRSDGPLKLVDETVSGARCNLLAKWFIAPIGLGRAPIEFTSTSRVVRSIYRNDTGRDMIIQIGNNPSGPLKISEDGVDFIIVSKGSSTSNQTSGTFMISPGYYYTSGYSDLYSYSGWQEIR